jgi:2-polyprenyl-3-methyl-5-hydroxy-6-metoxy-1,4-benzoquinol methylase
MDNGTLWAVNLFNKSVLKQQKYKEIVGLLGSTNGLSCLDIGGDNGVISYMLRQLGGTWKSADLDEQSVFEIEKLVQTDVYLIEGKNSPFAENEFDRIVIIDFLEHIPDDRDCLIEMQRILKPNGNLIINVPHEKNSFLRKFRIALGQTDQKHGHLRSGYTLVSIEDLIGDNFTVKISKTYSKFFSELIDTMIIYAVSRIQKGKSKQSNKGLLITGKDLAANKSMFRKYSLIYPFVWLFSQLDSLLFFTDGYMLIVSAKVNKMC